MNENELTFEGHDEMLELAALIAGLNQAGIPYHIARTPAGNIKMTISTGY